MVVVSLIIQYDMQSLYILERYFKRNYKVDTVLSCSNYILCKYICQVYACPPNPTPHLDVVEGTLLTQVAFFARELK